MANPIWSNLFWDAPWIVVAQITQVLKFRYSRYLSNYRIKHAFKQDMSPICNLCPLKEDDTCLHLLSCCTNRHRNNLHTNQYNKVVHALANNLLVHPTTRWFTIINVSKYMNWNPNNNVPSWLLPRTCYLPRCTCPSWLQPCILCILHTTPATHPPFTPHPNLKIQIY